MNPGHRCGTCLSNETAATASVIKEKGTTSRTSTLVDDATKAVGGGAVIGQAAGQGRGIWHASDPRPRGPTGHLSLNASIALIPIHGTDGPVKQECDLYFPSHAGSR